MSEMVISTDPHEAYRRAQTDALQDSCENAHFSSIGGMDKRASDDLMEVPEYIAPHCRRHYLEGYKSACEEMFGADWRTCPFGWKPVLVLEIFETGEDIAVKETEES